jgi:hypothetical protein
MQYICSCTRFAIRCEANRTNDRVSRPTWGRPKPGSLRPWCQARRAHRGRLLRPCEAPRGATAKTPPSCWCEPRARRRARYSAGREARGRARSTGVPILLVRIQSAMLRAGSRGELLQLRIDDRYPVLFASPLHVKRFVAGRRVPVRQELSPLPSRSPAASSPWLCRPHVGFASALRPLQLRIDDRYAALFAPPLHVRRLVAARRVPARQELSLLPSRSPSASSPR